MLSLSGELKTRQIQGRTVGGGYREERGVGQASSSTALGVDSKGMKMDRWTEQTDGQTAGIR